MRLRAPAMPIINVDPFFSVWSASNRLYDSPTVHWTGNNNTINGIVIIDGSEYRFMGNDEKYPVIKQISSDYDALSTYYKFRNEKIGLNLVFTSPRIPTSLYWLSAPITYLTVSAYSADGQAHSVEVKISVSEEICLCEKGQSPVIVEKADVNGAESTIKIGNSVQNPLNANYDHQIIDWGYFYLSAVNGKTGSYIGDDGMSYVCAVSALTDKPSLFVFAYDDIYSIRYFDTDIKGYWAKDGETIEECIAKAIANYPFIIPMCDSFSEKLYSDGVKAGGEKYAEILSLSFRQAMAAHKLIEGMDGELLFISKECSSGANAATADVSYPSMPLFLIYNPELLRGMLRPIFRIARKEDWTFPYAPHDAGNYPILGAQTYGTPVHNAKPGEFEKYQMPVEECGNMLIMSCASMISDGNTDIIYQNLDLLQGWADYLVENGSDPGEQLCTDDFAGHLAHNCNLSLKAIMGIASFSIICSALTDINAADYYMAKAREMADSWRERALNPDGSFRLSFDAEESYSMKYNAVWDKLFGTNILPKTAIESEISNNFTHFNPYGMPLDNRADYTKADWLVWTATLSGSYDTFVKYISPLWDAYNYSKSRVPLTDWYDTITANAQHFKNRPVVGGFFIKVLADKGIMNIGN